jgi:hypothetical protein
VWLRAGWAASLVLALGLGWTAREWAGPDSESVLDDAGRLERGTGSAVGVEPAIPGDVLPSQTAVTATQSDRAERGNAAVGSAAPAGTAPTPAANAPAARQQAARVPSVDPAPAPPAAPLAQESAASRATSPPPGGGREPGDAQIAAEVPPPPPASPSAPASATAQAPAAGSPAQEVVPTRREGVASVRAVAPSAAGPVQAPGLEWRAAARTEAAVRTGMPLYGIEGLTPVLTSVSSDGAAVRTVYRIETGEVVELVQARGTPAAFRVAVPPAPTVGDLAVQNLVPQGRAGVLADRAVAAPRALTTVRGDVRIVLSTTAPAANLDALGARLRVD